MATRTEREALALRGRIPLEGAWVLLAALAGAFGVGAYALIEPDEGRNAAIALEMAGGSGWLVPHLDGLPFLDKPFLFFAAAAAAIRLFGAAEWAVRLPSLLATWATLGLTLWFSRRLFGRETAWVAGTAFATALLTLAYARIVIFDALLTFFVTLALIAFYLAIEERRGDAGRARRILWPMVAWAAMAGGVFTKGPVALLLPLLVAVPFAAWRRRPGAVWHPAGWLLHLALVVPWVALVERAVPGFLHYSLVTESWQRLTTDALHRTGPSWYFLPVLAGGAFPWIVVALAAGWRRAREAMRGEQRPALVFLGLWIALPLVFFSLSHSKRAGYVLPLMPAVALLAAWSWSLAGARRRTVRVAAVGWLALSVPFLAVGGGLAPARLLAKVASRVPPTAAALGAVMLVTAALAWLAARQRLAPAALSLPLVLLPVLCAPLMAEIAESRSSKAMAAAVAPLLDPATTVMGIETFSSTLAFYLGRKITVSTASGAPLRSNYAVHLYPEVAGLESSPLQPPEAWRDALASCARPHVFLLKARYERERAALAAAGLPTLWADERLILMGPCRPPGPPVEEAGAKRLRGGQRGTIGPGP